jgi:cysteine synthase
VIPLPTGHTPLVALCLLVDGIERMLRLKLESFNACGSIKDRTAHSLLDALGNRVDPALGVIESTSGNLGVAMAALCAARRLPFTAVVDPSTSAMLVMRMRRLGAHVVVIDEPDSVGCYLLSRLRYVKRELRRRPGLTWSDQYSSEANVRAHYHGTAAELWGQLPVPTTVCVAGRVVGVDVVGSVALGGPAGPRLLSGIGSSRRATLLEGDPDETAFVSSREAVSACLWLLDSTGIDVGGSSGAVIAAALRRLREDRDLVEVTCICPDGGDRYLSTVYSAQWRQRHGLAPVEELGHDVVLLDPPAKTTMVGERAGR